MTSVSFRWRTGTVMTRTISILWVQIWTIMEKTGTGSSQPSEAELRSKVCHAFPSCLSQCGGSSLTELSLYCSNQWKKKCNEHYSSRHFGWNVWPSSSVLHFLVAKTLVLILLHYYVNYSWIPIISPQLHNLELGNSYFSTNISRVTPSPL